MTKTLKELNLEDDLCKNETPSPKVEWVSSIS